MCEAKTLAEGGNLDFLPSEVMCVRCRLLFLKGIHWGRVDFKV